MTVRTGPIRVLVVEDESITAQAHETYLGRLDGFECVGVARDGRSALTALRNSEIDLVLLDMNLPDAHGLQLVRALRSAGSTVDVVAVTAARDAEVVRGALSLGVVQYLIKPFTFRSFSERLEQYLAYRGALADDVVSQDDVDRGLASLRPTPAAVTSAPGVSPETLERVRGELRRGTGWLSAAEMAAAIDASRVTARRYLEHLAGTGLAERRLRGGGTGRPEYEYGLPSRPDGAPR